MDKILRRLVRRKTWVKIYFNDDCKSGNIISYKEGIVCLEYVYSDKPKQNMKIYIKSKSINSVECLACENNEVWTF